MTMSSLAAGAAEAAARPRMVENFIFAGAVCYGWLVGWLVGLVD